MKTIHSVSFIVFAFIAMSCGRSPQQDQPPLSLNPQNPHYFLFRDKPTVLIGSTEHYGAVLNLDFDYVTYLDEVAASGLNVTRTFSGVYLEPGGAFGILRNTLAPAPERYICPWARSSEPGYTNGGNKFDLMQWDPAYFTRLKDFITQAGKRGIIVELDLFSNFYDTVQWKLSPLYIANNVNSIGNIVDQKEILFLRHPEVLGIQEKMVRKIVSELKDFDNLYYEVCNEPYFGDTIALREWEKHMTGIVADAEEGFTAKHLISNNIANGQQLVSDRSESISIYNFHYAKPPVTVAMNYHHNRVIGDNETGFNGIEDATYRTEAWDFMMAGGGLFNHLDYSFTTDNEDGSNIIEEGQPGGGGKTLRNQFKILATFMKGIDFINMVPVTTDMMRLSEAGNTSFYGLAKPEELYAIYLHCRDTTVTKTVIEINLLTGSYDLTWLDTKTAEVRTEAIENHPGGWVKISSPEYLTDIALKIAMVK